MKIVFNYISNGGVFWYFKGLANAAKSCGHEVHFVPAEQQSNILDYLNKIESDGKPIDLLVSSANLSILTRALKKGILARSKMKVALYGEAHPNSEAAKALSKHPDLIYDIASPEYISNLDSIAKRVDLLFIHHHHNSAYGYLQGWENHVAKWCGVGMACDIVEYRKGVVKPEFICDASMISGYWEYKARKLRPWIFPLADKINLKIWGGSPFPIINYLGSISEESAPDVWASTTCNLQIHEPQSILGFECSERTFKVIGTGNFLVSDYVESLTKDYFREHEIVTAKTPEEYRDLIYYFLANPDKRIPYVQRGQSRVLKEHTYFERVLQICQMTGLSEKVGDISQIKNKIIEERKLYA